MSPLRCVICGGSDLLELCRWDPSISTDRRVLPVPTSTQVCRDCGATFNGGGARDQELSFYAEQYDLHGESAASEWQIYVDGSRRGETDAILEFVEQHVALGARGRLLEVGCGKGVFLGKFLQAHPEWSGFGIEPSANAVSYFEQILPTVEIHEGPFETAAFRKETFELVATSGVLEHVPDPVSFMEGVRGCMATGSRAFVGVPNFEAKPDDLLLFDHLTQFTPDSLDILYARVGLRRVGRSASPDRVWLWDMVEVGDSTPAPPAEHATRGLQLAESHQSRVRDGLSSFERMRLISSGIALSDRTPQRTDLLSVPFTTTRWTAGR